MKRRTKKLLIEAIIVGIILTTLTAFIIPKFLAAQSINTPRHFPDENFRRLVEKKLGVKPDEPFHAQDAANIQGALHCANSNITELKGIEYIKNIDAIYFPNNKVQSFDFTQNKKLKLIQCNNNKLENLNVSYMENLEVLFCNGNGIRDLDVTQNKKLKIILCDYNNLTKLNIDNNTLLESLSCNRNKISEINLSNNRDLGSLSLAGNQLEEIDLSRNINLRVVNLSNNKLVSIPKFPDNKILETIDLRDNLLGQDDLENIQNLTKQMPRPALTKNDHLISGFAYSIANATEKVKKINSVTKELTN